MDEWKASIVVSTRPGIGVGRYAVYYFLGKNTEKQGVVHVAVSPEVSSCVSDARAIAELSALHYLLQEIEVLSQGRTGKGVLITGSVRAWREIVMINALPKHGFMKLMEESRGKKYIPGTKMSLTDYRAIVPYAKSLLTRFGEATVECVSDVIWIKPLVAASRTHEIEVDGPPLGRLQMHGVGEVSVSFHAFDRFRGRGGNVEHGEAWKSLSRVLNDPSLKRHELPEHVVEEKMEKYADVGEVYIHPATRWQFVVTRDPQVSVPVVVTAYARI